MLFGIPFHAAFAFTGIAWFVTSPDPSPTLAAFAEFLHVWRMPAFFVVAGFFATLILGRRDRNTWIRGRVKRLGLPLLFGLLTVVPATWLIAGYARTGNWGDTVAFALSQLAGPSPWWTIHLWFLVELLIYCGILYVLTAAPIRQPLAGAVRRYARWATSKPVLGFLVTAAVASIAVVGGLVVWELIDGNTVLGGLISRNLVMFAPAFALGCVLGMSTAHLRWFLTIPAPVTVLVGAVGVVIVIVLEVVLEAESLPARAVQAVAWTIGGLAITSLAFRAAERWLSRPSRWVRWLVDGSLVIYLFHLPIVLATAAALFAAGITGWGGFAITVVVAFIGSVACYELVNAVPGLRYLATGQGRRGATLMSVTR
jgi:glucan biosynthesis protein C